MNISNDKNHYNPRYLSPLPDNVHFFIRQRPHQYFSTALGQLIYICMSHVRHNKGDSMTFSHLKEVYVVDYDLPAGNGRRQFYRYLKKVLAGCNWKKSSDSVILVDNLCAALAVLALARAWNAHHANVYKCVPLTY